MTPATYELHESLLRLAKGMIGAWERYLRAETGRPAQAHWLKALDQAFAVERVIRPVTGKDAEQRLNNEEDSTLRQPPKSP